MHLRASSRTNSSAGNGASAWSLTHWEDFITVTSTAPTGSLLAVTFSIHANYSLESGGAEQYQSDIYLGIANQSNIMGEDSPPAEAWRYQPGGASSLPYPDAASPMTSGTTLMNIRIGTFRDPGDLNYYSFDPIAGPTSNVISNNGIISWTQTIYIPYIEDLNGYNLNMFTIAGADTWRGGYAEIDSWNTITLDSIQLLDGTDISSLVTFESGYQFPSATVNSVPEPSSLLALCTGSLLCIAASRRKEAQARQRRQTSPAMNTTL